MSGDGFAVEFADQRKHAVQRTVGAAGVVAGDEGVGQQILVVDRLFALVRAHRDDFRQRHQGAVGGTHAHGQQLAKRGLVAGGEAQPDRHRIAGVAVHQLGRIIAGQAVRRACAMLA